VVSIKDGPLVDADPVVVPPAAVLKDPPVMPSAADGDPTMVPVETEVEPEADAAADSKLDVGKYVRSFGPDVDNRRVVPWHVDDVGVGGQNLDGRGGHDDLLLGGILEVLGVTGGLTQALDGGQHVFALVDERGADGLGPLDVLEHHLQHFRIAGQGLDRGIPFMGVDGYIIGRQDILQPLGRRGHVVRVGACGQKLGEERVRVEGDRPHHLANLVVAEL
jgi:hypothetical protein